MPFEVDFLPVGAYSSSGDAILLRHGDSYNGYKINLTDGGYADTYDVIKEHISCHFGGVDYIDNVILTHADRDHAAGLLQVMEAYKVSALWMHRPWLYAHEIISSFHGNWTLEGLKKHLREQYDTLVALESVAVRKGVPIFEPFQGAVIGPCVVLAPSRRRYVELLPDFDKTPAKKSEASLGEYVAKALLDAAKAVANWVSETWSSETLSNYPTPTSASNESSVVQAAIIDGKRIVLTGDVGPKGLLEAAEYASAAGFLKPEFIQVPHHGSRRNVTPNMLDIWLGNTIPEYSGLERGDAYCSSAKNDDSHPRKQVVNAFTRRGYGVYATNGITISWNQGMPTRPTFNSISSEPFSSRVEV